MNNRNIENTHSINTTNIRSCCSMMHKCRISYLLHIITLLLLAPSFAHAVVYKCIISGNVNYSASPCTSGTTSVVPGTTASTRTDSAYKTTNSNPAGANTITPGEDYPNLHDMWMPNPN